MIKGILNRDRIPIYWKQPESHYSKNHVEVGGLVVAAGGRGEFLVGCHRGRTLKTLELGVLEISVLGPPRLQQSNFSQRFLGMRHTILDGRSK